MKDSNGETIHIGEVVTLTQAMRPKRFIGYHTTVKSLGDVRLLIKLESRSAYFDQDKMLRVEPNMVVRGRQTITDPMYEDPRIKAAIKDVLLVYVTRHLAEAQLAGIISQEQCRQLIELFEPEI